MKNNKNIKFGIIILTLLVMLQAAFAVNIFITPPQTATTPTSSNNLICSSSPIGNYIYRWYNTRYANYIETQTLSSSYTLKNDLWTCKVFLPIPGEPQIGQASVTIRNSVPVATDGTDTTDENIAVLITLHATDADGDTLT